MGCPEEIDYSYVKPPPERSMGMQWGDVRVVTCSMGYHGEESRDCSKCNYYRVCDAPERANIEGNAWTPPMRSRREIEAKIKELKEGTSEIDEAMVEALEWVLGKREEL